MNRLAILEAERTELRRHITAVRTDAGMSEGVKLTNLDALLSREADLDATIAAEQIRRDAARSEPAIANAAAALAGVGFDLEPAVAAVRSRIGREPGAAISPRYADVFGTPKPAAEEGWSSFDEFLAVMHQGRHDPRMASATSMGTTVGSDGGFLVPEQYSAELLDAALEDEIVRPRAIVYPITQGDSRSIAGFDGTDHSSNLYGFASRWMGESETSTPQKGKVRLIKLLAHKLGLYAQPSNELVADGMSFEQLLGAALRAAIGFDLDEAFLTGNGTAKPLGMLNDPALVTVAKETGQGSDTIITDNVDKMFARMHPAGRRNGVWVANSDTIPQLLSLVRIVGTGGAPVPVMSESNGQFAILTRPVLFTEKVPTLGDAGDLSFVDFSQYAIGMRKEAVLDRSNAPGWFEDELSYRMILRVDGRGRWKAAMTPRKGSNTLSWAVTLGAR